MDKVSTNSESKLRYKDYGILILRLGTGLALLVQFAYYFLDKTESVQHLGEGAAWLGGAVLLFLVLLGNIAYILGYYTRFVSAFLAMVFALSCVFQIVSEKSYIEFSNDFMLCIVFISSIYLGGGKLSIDYKTNHYKIHLEGSGAL